MNYVWVVLVSKLHRQKKKWSITNGSIYIFHHLDADFQKNFQSPSQSHSKHGGSRFCKSYDLTKNCLRAGSPTGQHLGVRTPPWKKVLPRVNSFTLFHWCTMTSARACELKFHNGCCWLNLTDLPCQHMEGRGNKYVYIYMKYDKRNRGYTNWWGHTHSNTYTAFYHWCGSSYVTSGHSIWSDYLMRSFLATSDSSTISTRVKRSMLMTPAGSVSPGDGIKP